MNGRSSTATGLAATDAGSKIDYLRRIRNAAACLGLAQEALRFKETHEVRLAKIQIDEAEEEIRLFLETEATGEGEQGSKGLHGEDPQEAKVI